MNEPEKMRRLLEDEEILIFDYPRSKEKNVYYCPPPDEEQDYESGEVDVDNDSW